MSITILIDADILVYSVAYSVETPTYICGGGVYIRKGYAEKIAKEKGLTVRKRVNIGSEKELRKNLDTKLSQIYDDLGTTNAKLYITASKVNGNFRSQIATILPYKGNRTGSVKPFHYKKIRNILKDEYGAIVVHGQEADDAIAIEQTNIYKYHGNYDMSYIASIDKDLRTVPGFHYHLSTRYIDYVSEEEALKNFYRQLLVGDATDNIPGLVKLLKLNNREEEANKLIYGKYISLFNEKIIDYTPQETYNCVLDIYNKSGFGEKELNEIGNLLHLRRYEGQIWSKGNERN